MEEVRVCAGPGAAELKRLGAIHPAVARAHPEGPHPGAW